MILGLIAVSAFTFSVSAKLMAISDDPELIYVYDDNGDTTTSPPFCDDQAETCAWIHEYDPSEPDNVGAPILNDQGQPTFVEGQRL